MALFLAGWVRWSTEEWEQKRRGAAWNEKSVGLSIVTSNATDTDEKGIGNFK